MFFISFENLERFLWIKFSTQDALEMMLFICDENDIDGVNRIPRYLCSLTQVKGWPLRW